MKSDIEQLTSIVITQFLIDKSGLGQDTLAEILFPDQSEPRKKIQRWLAGGGISAKNQSAICEAYPETQCLFDLPLFAMLSGRVLSRADLEGMLYRYRKSDSPGIYWEVPSNSMLNPNPHYPIYARGNSQALAETGSVEAFVIILGLIRLARLSESDGSAVQKIKHNAAISYHLVQAARAFPHVARHSVFRSVWLKMYERFKEFWLESLPDPTAMILDDELIKTYVEMDAEYVLWRGAYGREPDGQSLITLPIPVILPDNVRACL